jgi:hypothetical protein
MHENAACIAFIAFYVMCCLFLGGVHPAARGLAAWRLADSPWHSVYRTRPQVSLKTPKAPTPVALCGEAWAGGGRSMETPVIYQAVSWAISASSG